MVKYTVNMTYKPNYNSGSVSIGTSIKSCVSSSKDNIHWHSMYDIKYHHVQITYSAFILFFSHFIVKIPIIKTPTSFPLLI